MHWIQIDRTKGTLTRGQANPPDADTLYFVDRTGCHALMGGVLFKDGKPAPPGTHTLTFDDGSTLPFTVPAPPRAAKPGAAPPKATRGTLTPPPAKGAKP